MYLHNFVIFVISEYKKMAELMTPEQAAQFVEKCEQEFKDRYSSEDKSYQQITSQPQTQPPLVISQPRPDDQEQRRYPAEPPSVQIDTNLENNPMAKGTWKHGNFGEAHPDVAKESGKTQYNVQLAVLVE